MRFSLCFAEGAETVQRRAGNKTQTRTPGVLGSRGSEDRDFLIKNTLEETHAIGHSN
jgi:hypothetical protein